MKKLFNKAGGVSKGAPSGFVISLAGHAAAFLLAGALVVFNVVKKEEKKFIPPPPVERPRMKLKKPKPRVKKTSKPKSTTRIVTKVQKVDMPDVQLPELGGMGDGLVGGLGSGFDVMPDLGEVTLFGGGQSIGNDFVGTFYDFKRSRRGSPVPMDPSEFTEEVRKFVASGFKISKIAKYYRSPKKLYATTFLVPPIRSSVAPSAFGEADTIGYAWMAHYKGQLVHQDPITFRFWGVGDDVLVVRVGGKVVLSACFEGGRWGSENIANSWHSSAKNNRRFYLGNTTAAIGDWITLAPGEPLDMEVILGEAPGGNFSSLLAVEVEGEEYDRNRQGGPILPIFKTTEPSLDLMDSIYRDLVPGEVSLTNGPVFRDFSPKGGAVATGDDPAGIPEEVAVTELESGTDMRIWTNLKGKQVEGEYIQVVGDNVVLKTHRGKQQKIPLAQLCEEDLELIELENPPEFNLTFTKSTAQRTMEVSPYLKAEVPPKITDYTFGVKLRQKSARMYDHELKVEFFSVAQELIGDKYILVDRGESSFVPTKDNKQSHEFKGNPIEFMETLIFDVRRGKKYAGYLITVSDKRGKVIQYRASKPWLWENIENLKDMPVGRYMDKTCTRVHPTSPKAAKY